MVHFVGAGPGAADLITVRGADLLSQADICIYAGSLVNPAVLEYCKPACEILNSASMTLEEVIEVMKRGVAQGKSIVRLHTGDPSLYGAIREQIDELEALRITYDVTPGVSSFSASAASLGAEYTLPGISQSVIITRMEGRTPVPQGERLRSMASHGCTMVLFLSTGLLEEAQAELLEGGYSPDTPAAIVYKASWPDEQVFRCTVATLAQTAREHGITKTALITIGAFLGGDYDRSLLYDPGFTHGFREGGQVMRTVSCIAFTKRGCGLAVRIASALRELEMRATVFGPERYAAECGLEPFGDLDTWTKQRFGHDDALVFVGAAGIAVRAVAPYVNDKYSDPAIVQVDETGAFAVPLLSGHVGGANNLAREIARICQGHAVISTATDVNGTFAVDEWACEHGLAICERTLAKRVSSSILEGTPVGFMSDFEIESALARGLQKPDGQTDDFELGIHITYNEDSRPFANTLHLVPQNIVIGAGCKKGTDPVHFSEQIMRVLAEADVSVRAIKTLASIDVKRGEPALRAFAGDIGCGLDFFSARELKSQDGDFSHSDFVEAAVGVDNVCERAAMRACENGSLICGKRVLDGVTVALAQDELRLGFENGGMRLLSVVGLGPGGADDMTLRARRCIERADLIVGYTVYVDLVKAEFPEKQTFTTPMRKEIDRCRAALEQAASGKRVALVCSGDPGVYGMAGLVYELAGEYEDVDIEVVPGVSAANGGAAVLGAALMHDYAVISLSDLLTPWELIERRLRAATASDFVICLYNPSSRKRADYLKRACDIFLESKSPETVCGFVRNIGRDKEESHITTLGELRNTNVDMFTTVFIGNSQTKALDGRMVTPRGYVMQESGPALEKTAPLRTFLVFGGTTEGRELATWLGERGNCDVIVSSATEYGGSLVEGLTHVRSRVGRLTEPEIEKLIANSEIACVIDATHPYADSISSSVKRACEATGVPHMRIVRAGESEGPQVSCADAKSAARYLNGREGNILLTTGSKELQTFIDGIAQFEERLFARVLPVPQSLERVRDLGIPASHVIAMQGPFSKELNCALIREYNIGILVTKSSGLAGGFEGKAAAARECGIELVVIERPRSEEGLNLEEAKQYLESRYGA